MYSRDYAGKTVNFEASGGLKNSSLMMQDQETDTYWSIMEGEAVAGELAGSKLIELPVGERISWRHWRAKHPDTLVLSVNGEEHGENGYQQYLQDPKGFLGQVAKDDRLATKEPIFAFHLEGGAYAVRQKDVENGKTVTLESGDAVFLFRKRGSSMFQSTRAFISEAGFEERGGAWSEKATGAVFDPEAGSFGEVEVLTGFDTFWYNFSLNNPNTTLLK